MKPKVVELFTRSILQSEAAMKTIGILSAWAALVCVIVYCVFSPENGVMFQNPMAAMSLGVIGLGLCMESKKTLSPVRVRSGNVK